MDSARHQFGKFPVQAIFGVTEPRRQHEAFRLPGAPVQTMGVLDCEEVVIHAVNKDKRDRGDPAHHVLGMFGLAP